MKAEEEKLAAAMQALEDALKSSQSALSSAELQRRIQLWFTAQASPLLYPKRENHSGKDESTDLRNSI